MTDQELIAHKRVLRIQRVKTWTARIIFTPTFIIGLIGFVSAFIFLSMPWRIIKSSNNKLTIQKEAHKPVKQQNKLEIKAMVKEMKQKQKIEKEKPKKDKEGEPWIKFS